VTSRLLVRVVLLAVFAAGVVASAVTYVSVVRTENAGVRFFNAGNFSRGNFERGLREFRASDSALNPSNYRTQNLAVMLLHLGQPVSAERVAARAARAEPQNAVLWVALARVQVARGKLVEARATWAHARRLDPHLPVSLPAPT
jgi:Flp pilus assembly protein TadD